MDYMKAGKDAGEVIRQKMVKAGALDLVVDKPNAMYKIALLIAHVQIRVMRGRGMMGLSQLVPSIRSQQRQAQQQAKVAYDKGCPFGSVPSMLA